MAHKMTVQQVLKGEAEGCKVFLQTWQGKMEVTGWHIKGVDIWAICGKANAGHGQSFMMHREKEVTIEDASTI